jgi:hypothetical protein
MEKSCLESLDKIVRSNPVKEKQLQEYLKLQSELTLHKLAWSLIKDENKEGFKVEKKILNLLETIKSKNEQDADFKSVYEMFKDPNNKLSRNALSKVLPYISDILNSQVEEDDPEIRAKFHINTADIKTLAILAEKEKKNKYGKYTHLLSTNRSSDKSVMNFTKMINSSVRNTESNTRTIRKRMKNEIHSIIKKAESLLDSLLDHESCKQLKNSCSSAESGVVLNESNLSAILLAVEDNTKLDKHKYLRYGDIWLMVKKSSERQRIERSQKEKVVFYPRKSKEDQVHDYLIDHVLKFMPYYLDRETLKGDKALTLGLAQAIDSGALAKKGEARVFYYKGEAYFIPELWNTSQSGSGRIGKELNQKIDNFRNYWMGENYTTPIGNGIKDSDKKEFEEVWLRTKENRGQKQAFLFDGKSYSILTGEHLPGEISTLLLNFKAPRKLNKKQLSFDEDKISIMVDEIKAGNRSYLAENGTAKHISGVPISLEQETARMQSYFEKGNYTVIGGSGINLKEKVIVSSPTLRSANITISRQLVGVKSFPSRSRMKSFVAGDKKKAEAVKKALADRKIATKFQGGHLNLVTLKVIDKEAAVQTIANYKKSFGISNNATLNNWDSNFLRDNAVAILNKKETFISAGKKYSSRTSRSLQSRKISSDPSRLIPRSEVVRNRDLINNESDDLSKIKLFQKNYAQKCEEYTIVDKKNAILSVFSNKGDLLYRKEILVGKKDGDERTRYYNAQTRETNNETGAGVYFIGSQLTGQDNFSGNALDLNTQNQNSRLSISQVANSTPERLALIGDNDPLNNRVTNGGIMLQKTDMKHYMSSYAKKDCPFYVLPETDEIDFVVRDNQLNFIPNCNGCDKRYNVTRAVIKSKAIRATITDSRYKNKQTELFVQTLVKEKKDLMPLLGISNDEYNDLVRISFGVLGAESEFGEHWAYKFKETKTGQKSVNIKKGDKRSLLYLGMKLVNPLLLTGPVGLVENMTAPADNPNNSRGSTQIKNVQEYLKGKYKNTINTSNLSNPKNSAIATMFVLANKLKSLKRIEYRHSAITEANRLDYLYYLYMGSTDQITGNSATPGLNPKVSKVNEYAKGLEIDEVI